jgi:hypothetical protein
MRLSSMRCFLSTWAKTKKVLRSCRERMIETMKEEGSKRTESGSRCVAICGGSWSNSRKKGMGALRLGLVLTEREWFLCFGSSGKEWGLGRDLLRGRYGHGQMRRSSTSGGMR